MREDGAFHFQAEGESQFYFFVFILDRISSLRSYCEIMEQRNASESTPTPRRGFFFSEPVADPDFELKGGGGAGFLRC